MFSLCIRCTSFLLVVLCFIAIVSSSNGFAQSGSQGSRQTDQRGSYFSKKAYDGAGKALPTFASSRGFLPSPVLDGERDLVAMYWKCWDIAFNHFRKVNKDSPFVSDYIDEAFNDNIFQWDTIFIVMFARYANNVFPAIQSLDNFYSRQHLSGYICREISEKTGEDFVYEGRKNTINPPLFSWAEVESFNVTGDKTRFAAVLPVLDKYVDWLNRDGDLATSDGKDWEKYGRRASGSAHSLYWNTGLGCGMDNTPRGGDGWVDMSCQMIIQYNNLAFLCDQLGKFERAQSYRNQAKAIADRINKWCWNVTDGFYYDVDNEGHQVIWKTAGTFWPLLAGVANKAQAARLVEHLRDPKTFWRPFVFPTLAADQQGYDPKGGYWLGGVWAPTNYMIIKGLEQYGFEDFAQEASATYLAGMAEVFKKTGTVWENYAPESFEPGKPAKGDFVGWSGCGPIALLIENVLGFRCDGSNNRLVWYLHRMDRHGIERLHFGATTASVIYDPAGGQHQSASVSVNTDRQFELVIDQNSHRTSYTIKPGNQKLLLQ